MTIVALILQALQGKRKRVFVAAAVAGLSNIAALVILNTAASAEGTRSIWLFLVFLLAAAAYFAAARYSSRTINSALEVALQRIKARLTDMISNTGLLQLEQIGPSEIRDCITQNLILISNAASQVGSILQSLAVFLFGLIYLASMSPTTLVAVCLFQLAAFLLYRKRQSLVDRLLAVQSWRRIQFLDRLMDLLRGSKELRLNRQRNREVLMDFETTSAAVRDASIEAQQVVNDNTLLITFNLYALLVALVFVLPKYMAISSELAQKLVASILFIWGSAQTGLGSYWAYVQANQALAAVGELEERFGSGQPACEAEEPRPWPAAPGDLQVLQLEYEYPPVAGETAFRIGPIDLTIAAGEVVFLVGGNGAGKSTFLKVLTGLYTPTRGTLKFGGISVTDDNVAGYREHITAIFAEFHLFSKLYGLLQVSPEEVTSLLEQLHIANKTSFRDGRFTERNLSTGQRKRLAMAAALLEDRPVLVFDEWAADQDPEFRRYFYEDLLPRLKQRGKTVIAASHDDRFFHCADRVLLLEYGQVRLVSEPQPVGGRSGVQATRESP